MEEECCYISNNLNTSHINFPCILHHNSKKNQPEKAK